MKKRLPLECWKCFEPFELTLEVSKALFEKDCPFCGARCQFDLGNFRSSVTSVLRGEGIRTDAEEQGWCFPEVIPTCNPESQSKGEGENRA